MMESLKDFIKDNKCLLTGLPIKNQSTDSYRIVLSNGKSRHIKFRSENLEWIFSNENFIRNKHVLAGAVINGIAADSIRDGYVMTITDNNITEKLDEIDLPRTPKEKRDKLITKLYRLQEYDGDLMNIYEQRIELYRSCYFRNEFEFQFYLREMHSEGLIWIDVIDEDKAISEARLLLSGLEYCISLLTDGRTSRNCFIAMSFEGSQQIEQIEDTIREVVTENNFNPVIIKDVNIESNRTINDEIIANIRSCKFCIADFTGQRNGVYFESGFAIGLGRKVIYTCEKESFKKSHFDTKSFQHIIYKDTDELRDRLNHKIKAWIDIE